MAIRPGISSEIEEEYCSIKMEVLAGPLTLRTSHLPYHPAPASGREQRQTWDILSPIILIPDCLLLSAIPPRVGALFAEAFSEKLAQYFASRLTGFSSSSSTLCGCLGVVLVCRPQNPLCGRGAEITLGWPDTPLGLPCAQHASGRQGN